MVYCELEGFPISINNKVRMVSFYCKIIATQVDKLSSETLCPIRNYNPWCNSIKSLLNDCRLPYIWQNSSVNKYKQLFLTLCMIILKNRGIATCLTPKKALPIECLRHISDLKAIY